MSKPPKKPNPKEIETEPDAWERFERAVGILAHTPPKPKHVKSRESRNKDGPKRGRLKSKRTGDGD